MPASKTRKKITGTITVEFQMSSENMTKAEMAQYIKLQLKNALKEEWQISKCEPIMSTFKYK